MTGGEKQQTFRLILEYDGSGFHGWQRQKSDRTVQATIESALAAMTREKVTVIGSGRTDAGVHAYGQTASFKTTAGLDAQTFFKGLNSLLPDDVVVRACDLMPDEFHARFDVKRKHYRYQLLNRPLAPAIGRRFVWHVRKPLNTTEMQRAARFFIGTHDFKAFEGAGSPRAHTVRTVHQANFQAAGDDKLFFDIEANGFLRFMVRNIIGTLVEVGLGKIPADQIATILQSKDRSRAGATAPPQGLFLMAVVY